MTTNRPAPLLSADAIAARVAELGREITEAFAGEELILACTLKGGFVFAADLARAIDLPVRIEFLRGESYGHGTASSGTVHVTLEPDVLLTGRNVLLVEDIIDTGRTAARLLELLQAHRPARLAVCALLHKPAREVVPIPVDFLGFTIEDVFVIGYGLDHAGLWRNLPYVGVLPTDAA